ncbi:MAG: acyl-CoA dehydrogenase family protein [Deltaproteobacteria bacterium]|nr:MAG: acyl-CoA dehydrogenase family protein [Deltaproteobacteria bacterium]
MFELDDTQRAFEDAARGWCEQQLAPAIPALESGEELPYALLRRLARDLGISELLVQLAERRIARLRGAAGGAAASGSHAMGLGGDPMLSSVLLKEISRVSPGFGMAFISTLGCAMAILAQGNAETIERHALPILRFETVGSWALTEPGAGSDAFGGMRSVAKPDGDGFVLTGQKTFISNAPCADVFAIYARVEAPGDRRPVRAFVVERGTPGLETGPPMRKMGMHDSPTGEIFLRDCRVPRVNLLGDLETAGAPRADAALETLNLERSVMPAMCLGIIERCVDESLRYAQQRQQFGRPIAEFQAIAFKLARMELALENARNLVFKLAWAQREGRLDARLASLAKLYCAEEAVRVSLDAIQIHGGAGYMAELPLEKLMRDAKMFEIGGGTNEIQLQTIARAILS